MELLPNENREEIASIFIADRLPTGLESLGELNLFDYLINGSIKSANTHDKQGMAELRKLFVALGGTWLDVYRVTSNSIIKNGEMVPAYYRKVELEFSRWKPYGDETKDFWNNGQLNKTTVPFSSVHIMRYSKNLYGFEIMRAIRDGSSYICGYGAEPSAGTVRLINEIKGIE